MRIALGLALASTPAAAQRHGLPAATVETRTVAVPGDLPVFHVAPTLRDSSSASPRAVFLHGACVHGLGYLQAFQRAAARHASTLALQGDRPCRGIFRAWSNDVARLDRRIAAAFRRVGDDRPLDDVILIGYSQGAVMAQRLVARFPDRYARVVLIGQPGGPDPRALRHARAVVAISGTRDNPAAMRAGARRLAQRGVPATFIPIPGATHGQLGDGNAVLDAAFAWIEAHALPLPRAPSVGE